MLRHTQQSRLSSIVLQLKLLSPLKCKKTIQFFHSEDRLKSPVAKKLVKDIRSTKKLYEEHLEQRKSAKQGPQNNIQITKKNVLKTSARVEQALKERLVEERALKMTNSSDTTTSSGRQLHLNQQVQPKLQLCQKHHLYLVNFTVIPKTKRLL